MIEITKIKKEDIDSFFELIQELAKHHEVENYILTNSEVLLSDGFASQPRFQALIAKEGDRAIGYASFTWNYSIWRGENYMNIDDVFILEEYRGRKIGEKLMLGLRDVCKDAGVKIIKWEVEKDNTGAIKFYRNLGAKMDVKGVCKWNIEV